MGGFVVAGWNFLLFHRLHHSWKIRPRLGDPKSTVDQKRQLYVLFAPKCKSWNLLCSHFQAWSFQIVHWKLNSWVSGVTHLQDIGCPLKWYWIPRVFSKQPLFLHLKADQNTTILWKRIKVTNDFVWKTAHSRDNSSNKLVLRASDSFKKSST